MVKCQRAQYDLFLYVIGVGGSWWEFADRVSFHGNTCRYGAWCCAFGDGGTDVDEKQRPGRLVYTLQMTICRRAFPLCERTATLS
jgi:hypothetical protein